MAAARRAALFLVLTWSFAAATPAIMCDEEANPEPSRFYDAEAQLPFDVFEFPAPASSPPPHAVILLHELDGLTCKTVRFAKQLATSGFDVYVPHLFGGVYAVTPRMNTLRLLFDSNWDINSSSGHHPILDALRTLTNELYAFHDGRKVGVIGMCLSGIFPLALLDMPAVGAAVVSQPSIPLIPMTNARKAALGLEDESLQAARESKIPFLGFRFEKDWISPAERWETLRREFPGQLRDCYVRWEEHPDKDAHSVLTAEYPHVASQLRVKKTIDYLERMLGKGELGDFQCPGPTQEEQR